MATSLNTPFAAYFGGSSYISNLNAGGLNQYITQNISAYGLLSFWFWTNVTPGIGVVKTILKMGPAPGFSGDALKVYIKRESGEARPRIFVRLDKAGSPFVLFRTQRIPYADMNFHHVILFWDTSVSPNVLNLFLDGQPAVAAVLERAGNATLSFAYKGPQATNQQWWIGTDGSLRGTPTQETMYSGALSEFFFDPIPEGLSAGGLGSGTGDALFKSYYSNRHGETIFGPANLGADGATVLGRKPAIYLHGWPPTWLKNHGGLSSFKATGSISAPASSIADPFWWRMLKGLFYFTQNLGGGLPDNHFVAPGQGARGIRASLFGVPTVLEASASEVKPAIADSPTGLVSFWYNANTTKFGSTARVISTTLGRGIDNHSGYTGYQETYALRIDIAAFGMSVRASNLTSATFDLGSYLQGEYSPAGGNSQSYMQFDSNAGLPNDAAWHHVIVAWDTSAPACKVYVDGVALTMTLKPEGSFPTSVPAIAYASAAPGGLTWQIGGVYSSGSLGGMEGEYLGHLSEVYINVADHDFVGALTESLVAKFRHESTGTAREIGATASLPFGPAGPKPDIYLSGQPDEFIKSFAKSSGTIGHRWGVDGDDADSTFAFRVIGGPLRDGNTDPFKPQEIVS